MADRKNYDLKKHSQAVTRAPLRGCVCVYLAFLAWQLIQGAGQPDTTMPPWANYLFAGVLLLGAAGFGVYIWRRYQADRKDAELPEEGEE